MMTWSADHHGVESWLESRGDLCSRPFHINAWSTHLRGTVKKKVGSGWVEREAMTRVSAHRSAIVQGDGFTPSIRNDLRTPCSS